MLGVLEYLTICAACAAGYVHASPLLTLLSAVLLTTFSTLRYFDDFARTLNSGSFGRSLAVWGLLVSLRTGILISIAAYILGLAVYASG